MTDPTDAEVVAQFQQLLRDLIAPDPVGFAVAFCREFYAEALQQLMVERGLSVGEAAGVIFMALDR